MPATASPPDGSAPRFDGFGPDWVAFFDELSAHNERTWWHANKERYAEQIGRPMQALAAALEPTVGPVKVFRPYRDVRFSADKRPVSEHASLAASPHGPALYLQVSAGEVLLAGGYWRPERAQLEAFRRLVDDPAKARGLHRHLATLDELGYELAPPSLTTAPRGYRRDHPEIELLRRTTLTVATSLEPGPWLSGPAALDRIGEGWEIVARWNRWLVAHLPEPTEAVLP